MLAGAWWLLTLLTSLPKEALLSWGGHTAGLSQGSLDAAGLRLVRVGGGGRPQNPLPRTGIASVVVSFFLSMYYNVINAWAFWYLFHSFQVSWPSRAGPGGEWGRGWTEQGPVGDRLGGGGAEQCLLGDRCVGGR